MTHYIELDIAMLEGEYVDDLQDIDQKDDLVIQTNAVGGGRVIKKGVSYFNHIQAMTQNADTRVIIHTTASKIEEATLRYASLRQTLIATNRITLPEDVEVYADKLVSNPVSKPVAPVAPQKKPQAYSARDTLPIEATPFPGQKFTLFYSGSLTESSALDFSQQGIHEKLIDRDVVLRSNSTKAVFDINGSELFQLDEQAQDDRLSQELPDVIRQAWHAGFKFSTQPSASKQAASVVATWSILNKYLPPQEGTPCFDDGEVFTLHGTIDFNR